MLRFQKRRYTRVRVGHFCPDDPRYSGGKFTRLIFNESNHMSLKGSKERLKITVRSLWSGKKGKKIRRLRKLGRASYRFGKLHDKKIESGRLLIRSEKYSADVTIGLDEEPNSTTVGELANSRFPVE